jgi:hypothetical protein
MNLRNTSLAALIACTALGAWAQTPAPAAPATPQVDQRQQQQQARIQQGVASGALTGREARRLQREQRAIQRAETQAKADGVVTPGERPLAPATEPEPAGTSGTRSTIVSIARPARLSRMASIRLRADPHEAGPHRG